MQLHLTWNESDPTLHADFARLLDLHYAILGQLPGGFEEYFRQRARYVSAHTSTAIEGNPLGDERAMLVLIEGADPTRPDELEKTNVELAYAFLDQLAQDPTLLIDQGLVRSINSQLLRGLPDRTALNRGQYRRGQSLVVDSLTRAVRYVPPAPEAVPGLMEALAANISGAWRDLPPAVAAAFAHFGLVSVHPFDDGNGRTARIVSDLVLWQTPLHFGRMLSVSKAIFDDREAYYTSLREAQGARFQEVVDVTPFLAFHTRALLRAADALERQVASFRHRQELLLSREPLNDRQLAGIMFMLDIGPLSSSAYAALTRASQSTATADLAFLLRRGLCERSGSGKLTRYHASRGLTTASPG